MSEPKYPLSITEQKRIVFLLAKYLATSEQRPGARKVVWDLTKCDEETRKFFGQIGQPW